MFDIIFEMRKKLTFIVIIDNWIWVIKNNIWTKFFIVIIFEIEVKLTDVENWCLKINQNVAAQCTARYINIYEYFI